MKLKIFAVYDSKVAAYMQPFFMRTTGEALRAWGTTAADTSTQFNKYPGDFSLFEIGSFNEETGEVKALPARINLGTALEHQTTSLNNSADSDRRDRVIAAVENNSERAMQ